MSNFLNFFRPDTSEELAEKRVEMERRGSVLRTSQEFFFKEFVQWLEGEADRPVSLQDDRNMLHSAIRANTFKEVRNYLRRHVALAESPLSEE